jgi:hypothetical protein
LDVRAAQGLGERKLFNVLPREIPHAPSVWKEASPCWARNPSDNQEEERMPPRGVKSPKRQRQYAKIKQSARKRGTSEARAEELAARVVNKQRSKSGETKGSAKKKTAAKKSAAKRSSTKTSAKNSSRRAKPARSTRSAGAKSRTRTTAAKSRRKPSSSSRSSSRSKSSRSKK